MKPLRSVIGRKVSLRAMDESAADAAYLGWLNDSVVTQYLEARFTNYTRERLEGYIRAENERADAVLFGIHRIEDGARIGTIKLSRIRPEHRHCEIGLMIGDRSAWGRGYGAEAIALSCGYAFTDLKLHKVSAGCYGDNLGSARAFEKAGFVVEGRLREDRWSGDHWVDKLWLGLINPAERETERGAQP
jgi:RimJ/RimL family protein N-acetyltransferase